MPGKRCIYCGRLCDTDERALFRLPADHGLTRDAEYGRFLAVRGIKGRRSELPAICGERSPECSKVMWENGRQVLITRTGRTTDIMVCPSCHGELFRDTDCTSVTEAVFFGDRGSGRTSLILALAGQCITKQFSPDDKYRYMFNDKLFDPDIITGAAENTGNGEPQTDLRDPVCIYRVPGAKTDGAVLCDVMHDVSASDTADDLSMYISMPFAASAAHFVYCLPLGKFASALETEDGDLDMKLGMFCMINAAKYAETPPVLDFTITKTDLWGTKTENDVMNAADDEAALGDLVRRAFPCISELGGNFSGIRFHTVSALPAYNADEKGGTALKLYSRIFG